MFNTILHEEKHVRVFKLFRLMVVIKYVTVLSGKFYLDTGCWYPDPALPYDLLRSSPMSRLVKRTQQLNAKWYTNTTDHTHVLL